MNRQTIKPGHIHRVENLKKHPNANESYYAGHLFNGQMWIPLLMTDHDLQEAVSRAHKNPEDIPPLEPSPPKRWNIRVALIVGAACGISFGITLGAILF